MYLPPAFEQSRPKTKGYGQNIAHSLLTHYNYIAENLETASFKKTQLSPHFPMKS